MQNKAKISLLLPTRNRPKQLMRMLDSLYNNVSDKNSIEVILYIDDDDIESGKLSFDYSNIKKIVGPQRNMGILNSSCLKQASGDIIMLINDDIVVRTPAWDQILRDCASQFSDQIYLLYPNDLHKKAHVSTFPILSAKTCQLVNDIYPSNYQGALIDVHIHDIFKRLHGYGYKRSVYIKDMIFEHMHYIAGKSDYDKTYQARHRFGDDNNFIALVPIRQQAAQLLSLAIKRPSVIMNDTNPVTYYKNIRQFSIETLFQSKAPFIWRIKLLIWIWGRKLYGYLIKFFKKSKKITLKS